MTTHRQRSNYLNQNTSLPNIAFYGERGVVNGIVLDLHNDLEKQKIFLKKIRFCGGNELSWIDDVENVTWLIEPSFSEFGNPDLIIVAEAKKKKYVLFVEAKLKSYDDSSFPINKDTLLPEYGYHYEGIASKLNVQLAFRYRFSKAYRKMKNGVIEEDNGIANYSDTFNRRIHNPVIVDYCKHYFGDPECFYFVALTNDKDNSDKDNNDEIYSSETLLPPIRQENWFRDHKFFGLLSYQMLEKEYYTNPDNQEGSNLIDRKLGFYGMASSLMLGLPANSASNLDIDKIPSFISKNIETSWSDIQKELSNYLNIRLNAKKMEGSYSVIRTFTVIKVLADFNNTNQILIGLRDDNIPLEIKQNFIVYKVGVGDRKKLFRCYSVKSNEEIDDFYRFIEIFLSRYEAENEISINESEF